MTSFLAAVPPSVPTIAADLPSGQVPAPFTGDGLWALVPCAGVGSRAGSGPQGSDAGGAPLPKQYWRLLDRALVEHTLDALGRVARLKGVLLVVAPGDAYPGRLALGARVGIAACGGTTRADSVANGLRQLRALGAAENDWVLVHDAARCLVTPEQIDKLIDACLGDPVGGLLALPLPDTLKSGEDGRVDATLSRRGKWLAQTPQMFRIGLLSQALAAAASSGTEVTDESSAVEALGLAPRLVEGSAQNFKVTYPDDFALAEAVLLARRRGRDQSGRGPGAN